MVGAWLNLVIYVIMSIPNSRNNLYLCGQLIMTNQFLRIYMAIVAVLISAVAFAVPVRIAVSDAETGELMEFAAVALTKGELHAGGLTDREGVIALDIAPGRWNVTVSMVGYQPSTAKIDVASPKASVEIKLQPVQNRLNEVVVTAQESRGATSASVIDVTAMQHLQPSSFSDLMELLPGQVNKDPEMGSANLLRLREAANASTSDNYDTGSLGASFVVDGVPVNSSADMLISPDGTRGDRSAAGKGVDMRTLSTDDIEQVEVVRGIPSVEYGELTSGLVNIKRKNRVTRLEARFKADMQSQLFYVGKGVKLPGDDWTLNVSADYLDSKIDPRNKRDNFKRVTASVRSLKKWTEPLYIATWNTSVNYTGTFERDDNDPDLTINGTTDFYKSSKNGISWQNILNFQLPLNPFWRNATITTGLTYSRDKLHQEKTVASNRVYPLPVSLLPGSNYVGFLPMVYDAMYDMEGEPLTAYVKGNMQARYSVGSMGNLLKAGVEWNMSKNLGDGAVYDITRPLVAGNTSRPRAFSDIPAMHQVSAYVENVTDFSAGRNQFQVQLGLRETQLVHLDSRYALSGKPYFDPRANLKWVLPSWHLSTSPMVLELNGGVGWLTKMPVASMLYPDLLYTDFTQLNFFHNEEPYRVMNVYTYVEDLTNYELRAARNFKWEARADLSWMGNRLSVTYFRERMSDGFRRSGVVHRYDYNKYDASAYDPYIENRPPTIDELPHEVETRLNVVNHTTNGSKIDKEGVEYTLSTRRFPIIRTRLTVSGAWFRTTLHNSQALWYKPGVVLNGKELQYVGLYDDDDGNRYESVNTNFTFDTDVPRLGLNFSVSVQNMWLTSNQSLERTGMPTHYMGPDMVVRPYTPDLVDDPYLKHLVRTYSPTAFERRTVPLATTFNIKATKKFWNDRVAVALYVNRLVSITPDYERYGVVLRRYSSPYFGMELNLRL